MEYCRLLCCSGSTARGRPARPPLTQRFEPADPGAPVCPTAPPHATPFPPNPRTAGSSEATRRDGSIQILTTWTGGVARAVRADGKQTDCPIKLASLAAARRHPPHSPRTAEPCVGRGGVRAAVQGADLPERARRVPGTVLKPQALACPGRKSPGGDQKSCCPHTRLITESIAAPVGSMTTTFAIRSAGNCSRCSERMISTSPSGSRIVAPSWRASCATRSRTATPGTRLTVIPISSGSDSDRA